MLTPKRERFVQHYVVTGSASEAARLSGYSARSAKQEGSRLLTFVDVQRAVETERAKLRDKADLDAELVLDGLLRIAQDEDNAPAARVSAYRSLGDFLNLWHRPSAIDEMAKGFLEYLAGTSKPVIEADARIIEQSSS